MRCGIGAAGAVFFFLGIAHAGQSQWGAKEHQPVPQDNARPAPKFDEGLQSSPDDDWAGEQLREGRDFADSFLGPKLFPKVAASTSLSVDRFKDNNQLSYSSSIDVQLYVLEVKVPLVMKVDGTKVTTHVRANLKIPFAVSEHESHRFALVGSAVIMDSTPSIAESSNAQLMYGFGGGGFTLQARGGYGYEQFLPNQDLRLGFLYGGIIGFRAGSIQPIVEVDGFRDEARRSNRVTLAPALYIFPNNDDAFQLGLGGLVIFTKGENEPAKRYGGIARIGYNFF